MPPATLRRRPLPLFIASSKITSSVGADSISARRFPTNGHLLYTAGPGMPGPYSVVVCFPRCHFCQNPPPQGGFFYALIHFTARKNCGILNKLLNSQQHAALPHAHKGVTAMIRIVTDSAADLTAEQLSVPGIFVVPLSVTFADGTTQLDDGTMTMNFSSAWQRTASCPAPASPARPALCRCMRMPPPRGMRSL